VLTIAVPWSPNANVPPLVYQLLMAAHAEPGGFGLLVISGVM
jgi:hypothetical protein